MRLPPGPTTFDALKALAADPETITSSHIPRAQFLQGVEKCHKVPPTECRLGKGDLKDKKGDLKWATAQVRRTVRVL